MKLVKGKLYTSGCAKCMKYDMDLTGWIHFCFDDRGEYQAFLDGITGIEWPLKSEKGVRVSIGVIYNLATLTISIPVGAGTCAEPTSEQCDEGAIMIGRLASKEGI